MSVRLGIGEVAARGFEPEQLGIRVFSVEELCWFIRENAGFLEEGFCGKELREWLAEECGLGELSRKLEQAAERHTALQGLVGVILEYTGFFPPEEKREILARLSENRGQDVCRKRKARGDLFLDRKQYGRAGREYGALLSQLPPEEKSLRGELYHSCGVLLARLFYFSAAARYFEQAYELTGRAGSYRQYLWCLKLAGDGGNFTEYARGHEESGGEAFLMDGQLMESERGWKSSPQSALLAGIEEEKERDAGRYEEKLRGRISLLKAAYREMVKK